LRTSESLHVKAEVAWPCVTYYCSSSGGYQTGNKVPRMKIKSPGTGFLTWASMEELACYVLQSNALIAYRDRYNFLQLLSLRYITVTIGLSSRINDVIQRNALSRDRQFRSFQLNAIAQRTLRSELFSSLRTSTYVIYTTVSRREPAIREFRVSRLHPRSFENFAGY